MTSKEYTKQWRKENKDKVSQYNKAWYSKPENKEYMKKYRNQWRKTHKPSPESIERSKQTAAIRRKLPEVKERISKYQKQYTNTRLKYTPTGQTINFGISRPIRVGHCSVCNKNIGDPYVDHNGKTKHIKKTVLHHIEYNDSNPLDNVIELCVSCHNRQHLKDRERVNGKFTRRKNTTE